MTTDRILGPGAMAPDFRLRATPDQNIALSELRGHPVVLAFYPFDWSAVCSDQLNVISAALPLLAEHGAVVLGISVDSVWSHLAFAREHGLHFPLLSDFEPKGSVARLYGAYDNDAGTCRRALFVLDPDGVIAWSYLSPVALNPGVDGVLDALAALGQPKNRSNIERRS